MRLQNKTAIVVGAGQAPGDRIGNGRATVLAFARAGARVLCVDRDLASAEETATAAGNGAIALQADVTRDADMAAMVAFAMKQFGRIDILHYNVGVSMAGGDKGPLEITEDAFDRVNAINLRGYVMAVKHTLPVMRAQMSGSIIAISSIAAWAGNYPTVAYKTSKAGMIAFTEQVAIQHGDVGVRANVIVAGLIDTPMAVDTRVREWGRPREEIVAERDKRVPLRRKMGSAWDVAHAALFLASDEANYITGIALPVDGGLTVRRD